MAPERLAGKTALVTGGARRIGREIAMALAAEGMHIVIHYNTSQAQAEELQALVHQFGVRSWTVQADFADLQQTQSLIQRVLDLSGDLYLLVNNAAGFPEDRLQGITFEDLMQSALVDAWAPFSLSRQFHQLVGRGKIINLVDARVNSFDFRHASYILSKHLLDAMTRMQAVKYAPRIAINAIMPGLILPPPDKDEAYLQSLTDTVPLKRHGDPEEIAAAAVFLARSTFMIGAVIHVDGGRHLKAYDDPSSDPHR